MSMPFNLHPYIYTLLACVGLFAMAYLPQFALNTAWLAASGLLWLSFSVYRDISGCKLPIRFVWAIVSVLFAGLFATHSFDSPSIFVTEQQVSANAEIVSVYYHLDKLILGLIILFTSHESIKTPITQNKVNPARLLVIYLAACAIILFLAVSTAILYFEPKLLPAGFFFIWAFKNLVLVCFGEELLFRGFIQKELSKWHPIFAWLLTSVLFGLAHLPAGLTFATIATLAGLLYGWVYLKTHNIWLAVVAHFVFNTLHLIFFTYPYLTSRI